MGKTSDGRRTDGCTLGHEAQTLARKDKAMQCKVWCEAVQPPHALMHRRCPRVATQHHQFSIMAAVAACVAGTSCRAPEGVATRAPRRRLRAPGTAVTLGHCQ